MNKPSLGKLEAVDLRSYWEDEVREFTPWLAQPENLKLLGDAVGLDLEIEAQEKDVGPFKADILCKDTETSNWVIIENQLEPTNHSHLGQLLTYAAGLQASTVIWISERFRPEHRAALDWLNEWVREGLAFYGVEVELLKIGDSAPAPRFNIVSKPNDFSKEAQSGASIGIGKPETEWKQTQLSFWTAFRDYLNNHSKIIRPQKPAAQHWMNHSIGKSGCHLASIASFWNSEEDQHKVGGELRVDVVLSDDRSKLYFSVLQSQKEHIERKVGEQLRWHNPPDKRMCRISTRRDADLSDKSKWPEYEEWLRTKLEKFHSIFGPASNQCHRTTLWKSKWITTSYSSVTANTPRHGDDGADVPADETGLQIGVFCLSPRKGSIQILDRPTIMGEFGECADDHINVEWVRFLLELVQYLRDRLSATFRRRYTFDE